MSGCKNLTFFYIFLCFIPMSLYSDIGSDTAVSRQPLIIFSGATNNTVLGFAALAGGFFLTDSATSFSFNAYFPVGTIAGFNSGTCYLMRDMSFDSYIDISTSGTIEGNFHTLEFAPRSDTLLFPTAGQSARFDRDLTGTTVYSVDWSTTDTYLLAGTALSSTSSELQIFYFDQNTLLITPTAGINLSVGVNEVGWQPVNEPPYFFAASTTDGVRTFTFDPTARTVTAVDTQATGSAALGLSWEPNGGFLAISSLSTVTMGSDILAVFSVSSGVMTRITTTNSLPIRRRVTRGSLAWNSAGTYLAVGTDLTGASSGYETLFLYYYNGATLSLVQSIRITGAAVTGYEVRSLSWSHDGTLLAVGLSGSTDKIRIFEFNGSTLTENTSYRNGETQNVYNIAWEVDDLNLAYVRGTGANYEVRACIVDRVVDKLLLFAQGTLGGNGLGVSWNHKAFAGSTAGIYVATGDDATYTSIWGIAANPFVLDNLDLVFNGPVQLTESIIIRGICSVTSNGSLLDINNKSIVMDSGAQLTVYNTHLYGMGGGYSVVFTDTSALIILQEDTIVNTRDFYLRGPLYIAGDVKITGTFKFTYSTDAVSTIAHNAQLYFDSGITFSYDPPSGANNLLSFESEASELYLNEVTSYINSVSGMMLTKGTITVDGICPVYATHGLYIGDGASSSNNPILNILPDSGLKLNAGYMINQTVY